jgi:hypothetical protein
MSTSAPARRRLRVGRLDLDLRGIAPATAEAAARALGPALAHALTSHRPLGPGADRIEAGRIESPASPDAHDLAAGIARRIARALEREGR